VSIYVWTDDSATIIFTQPTVGSICSFSSGETMFAEQTAVTLIRDLPQHGLREGAEGFVVACHPGDSEYEVTFTLNDGNTLLTVVVSEDNLRARDASSSSDESTDPLVKKLQEKLAEKLRDLYMNVDNYKVKEAVDSGGIDAFINRCAKLAATSGAAAGVGGIASAIALPADAINLVLQHIRVTLAVIYDKTGSYDVSFAQLLPVLGASVGVTAGALGGAALAYHIAGRIAVRLVAGSAGRVIPILGAVVGGSLNYGYIKAVGKVLQNLDIENR
jgi:hypothetical protein